MCIVKCKNLCKKMRSTRGAAKGGAEGARGPLWATPKKSILSTPFHSFQLMLCCNILPGRRPEPHWGFTSHPDLQRSFCHLRQLQPLFAPPPPPPPPPTPNPAHPVPKFWLCSCVRLTELTCIASYFVLHIVYTCGANNVCSMCYSLMYARLL